MQGDRVYQRHSADLQFFSKPASFPLGPFLLSQVSGAPVLPGFVIRQGWLRYLALIGDPIAPAGSAVGSGEGDAGLRRGFVPGRPVSGKNTYDPLRSVDEFF